MMYLWRKKGIQKLFCVLFYVFILVVFANLLLTLYMKNGGHVTTRKLQVVFDTTESRGIYTPTSKANNNHVHNGNETFRFGQATHSSSISEKKVSESQKHKQSNVQRLDVIRSENVSCPESTRRTLKPDDEVFQPIAGSRSFVYSAIVVSREKVRIIVLHNRSDDTGLFFCSYKHISPDFKTVYDLNATVAGKIKLHNDGHGRLYTAAFLTCPFPATASKIKDVLVSITYGQCKDRPSNLLPVHGIPDKVLWEFTVCIAPLHGRFHNTDDLVEMIELNRILGAEHFYFYNESISPMVEKVLLHYHKEGLASILQWHVPYEDPDHIIDIHYHGQMAAINDCLYRNRKRSKYVVVTDVDEFIIPHNPNITNWSQLVKSRLDLNSNSTSFMVRMSHYRKDWIYSENKFPSLEKAKKYKSSVLQHIQRENNIFDHRIRSKYIVKPLQVFEGGIHFVQSKELADRVPESEAIVHHYKRRPRGKEPPVKVFDDIVVRRYGDSLIKAVEKARTMIGLT